MVKTSDFDSENSGSSPDAASITPEMIEAGLRALAQSGRVYRLSSSDHVLVSEIFAAMRAVEGLEAGSFAIENARLRAALQQIVDMAPCCDLPSSLAWIGEKALEQ